MENEKRLIESSCLLEQVVRIQATEEDPEKRVGQIIMAITDAPAVEVVMVKRWVPVTERLPDKELWEYQKKYNEDNMEVLVMIKGAKEPTTLHYGDEGDFDDDEGNSWLVTHWMPLPEPPKEEIENE